MLKLEDLNVDGYERVVHATDSTAGLDAVIAVHNTKLGVAFGGTRITNYQNFDEHLIDALNLSEAMSYKNALAGTGCGGGKSVINLKGYPLTDAILQSFGEALNELNKDKVYYIAAGDVGSGPKELETIGKFTRFVASHEGTDSGEATAFGVWCSIQGAASATGRNLKDMTLSIAGLGKVGRRLLEFARPHFKKVYISDVVPGLAKDIAKPYKNVESVSTYVVHTLGDVYAPCALGGAINVRSLASIPNGTIVCGGANNQVANEDSMAIMMKNDIVYVPDFVANAGGVILLAARLHSGDTSIEYHTTEVNEQLSSLTSKAFFLIKDSAAEGIHAETLAIEQANEKLV